MRLVAHGGPSYFVGPFPFREPMPSVANRHIAETEYKNIAILLVIKGIAIVYIRKFCYIRSAKSKNKLHFLDMAKVVYKSYNQNDSLLFPHCIGDFIPENDPVRVLDAIVEHLDISAIEATYKGGGASSFAPRMLLKVVLYAYLQNIHSGRKMEAMLKRDINFMWLSGMQHPDFNTINLFRKNRLADVMDDIFTQVVQMLVDAKFVSLEVQYIDGTKIEANANKYTFVWKKATRTNQDKLDLKVKSILREAESVLDMEFKDESDNVMTAEEMQKRTDDILSQMDASGISDKKLRKAVTTVKDESVPKMKEYEEKLEIVGERGSYSKTDKDATFMRMKEDAMNNGQTKPGYNVQIATENQFITNYGLYHQANDQGTMIPFLESFRERYGTQSTTVCADSGYGSEMNYEYMVSKQITPFVKYNMFHAEMKRKRRNNPFLIENMFYNKELDFYVCPMGQHMELVGTKRDTSELGYVSTRSMYRANDCSKCPLRSMCYTGQCNQRTIVVNHRNNELRAMVRELLTSDEGLMHRSRRPIEPEAVFGQIKYDNHFKRFCYRGKRLVKAEFAAIAIAHNIRKMISKGYNVHSELVLG